MIEYKGESPRIRPLCESECARCGVRVNRRPVETK